MFKKIFIKLCTQKGVAPTVACQAVGLSNAAYSNWNEKTIPRKTTLIKIAEYFGVTVDYLLGKDEETQIILNEDEKRLIAAYRNQSEEGKKMVRKLLDIKEPTNRVIDDLTSDPITDLQTTMTNAFTKTTT